MDNNVYYIWLSLVFGPGSRQAAELLRRFPDIRSLYECDDYPGDIRLTQKQRSALEDKDLAKALEINAVCVKKGIGVAGYHDRLYPERLRAMNDPPALLYYRGALRDLENEYLVSVVGTRSMTEYGGRITEYFCAEFASAGAIVVSGMASGIDSAAHRGCLSRSGYTIAVLGTAIDRPYPQESEQLYYKIIETGAVISEYAPGTPYFRNSFPLRNRIIAGISNATLVTEAGERSGALITAKDAIMQGKEVYALPGLSGSRQSVGTNTLLQKGVRLAYRPSDVLATAELMYPDKIHITAESYRPENRKEQTAPQNTAFVFPPEESATDPVTGVDEKHDAVSFRNIGKLEPDEVTVIKTLKGAGGGMYIDEVVALCGLDAGIVMSTLTVLEVYGIVSQKNDGRYVLV